MAESSNRKGKSPINPYNSEDISPNSPPPDDNSFQSLLHHQRREIAAASALYTDVDFAYNLQMEEAIASSLAMHSSSASHSPGEDDILSFVHEKDVVLDFMPLILQDIERLDQELRDHEASESLMMEERIDLDRRIHDQKLASEIAAISDADWEEDGDNYEKPYEALGSSSRTGSLSLVYSECFKVYCKGLVSEETIKEKKVAVSGIGVAICDSKDNIIFEVSKGLEERDNEQAVQIQALIAGLNAALVLDLKTIGLFFDDSMVYQFVTGRVQSKENRISTLVNEVSGLQNRFTNCRPFLIALSEVKFAYKLARDAIVAQITWSAESSTSRTCLRETCSICCEDTTTERMFTVEGCLHRYCFSCMKKHVEVKLLNGMEATCPHDGCQYKVSIDESGKFLDLKLVEILSQRKKEASISVTEKIYCPYTRCSALMSKSEVLEYTNGFFVDAEKAGARKCIKCRRFFCINCKVAWHENITCNDYKKRNPHGPKENRMLRSLAKEKQWRECSMCGHMVELSEGCYHITCRCGYEFCYICGAPWKNKKATCSCNIWDENYIIGDGQGQ